VDVLSEAPMASAFLCHIIGKKLKPFLSRFNSKIIIIYLLYIRCNIDSAALPSKETSHKITTRLLQKLKPG
jgi:hypothetical protein